MNDKRLMLFTYSLPVGEIIVQWPAPLPEDQMDIIVEWFQLVQRQLTKQMRSPEGVTTND